MDTRRPRKSEPSLEPKGGDGEHWGVDPQDVRRHAQRMREAKSVGPLGKLSRIAAVGLLAVGAIAVFWNLDTLRSMRFDSSRLTSLFRGDSGRAPPGARPGAEPGTEVVGDSGVAGVSMPTSVGGEGPAAETEAAEPPATEASARAPAETPPAPPAAQSPSPATEPPPAASTAATAPANDSPVTPALPQPEPEPELPPAPETLGFGLSVMHVSEADAGAAVLVLRDGGTRGVSPFTWWTTDGTATAGSDFARLEPRVERFTRGEQNRTVHVPIVGDRSVEGPESFFVRVVAGESRDAGGPIAEIEVVIDDDD